MGSVLNFTHFLSLAAWIGGLLVLLGVVMPTLVRVLSDDLADAVSHHVLRAYYMIAGACAIGAVVSLVIMANRGAVPPYAWPRLALLLTMSMLTGAGAGWIQPRVDALRQAMADFGPDDMQTQAVRLTALQAAALRMNGLVLLLGLVNLWLAVGGPGPIN